MTEDDKAAEQLMCTSAREVADLATTVVREHVESKPSSEDVNRRLKRLEERVRRFVLAVAAAIVVAAIAATYLAVWGHELYRDACEAPASNSGVPVSGWCSTVFPFDDNSVGVKHEHGPGGEVVPVPDPGTGG